LRNIILSVIGGAVIAAAIYSVSLDLSERLVGKILRGLRRVFE
jgi:hypothetical protein